MFSTSLATGLCLTATAENATAENAVPERLFTHTQVDIADDCWSYRVSHTASNTISWRPASQACGGHQDHGANFGLSVNCSMSAYCCDCAMHVDMANGSHFRLFCYISAQVRWSHLDFNIVSNVLPSGRTFLNTTHLFGLICRSCHETECKCRVRPQLHYSLPNIINTHQGSGIPEALAFPR